MPRLLVTPSARARWGGPLAAFAPLAVAAMALALGLVAGLAAPARAQDSGAPPPAGKEEPVTTGWRPRPVRSGTVSLGGAVVYGTLLGSGLGQEFASGVGLGFNLRYRAGYDGAYGLSFEAHNFAVASEPDSDTGHHKLQVIETTFDYYAFGATRTRMPGYLVIGAGLAQTQITDRDGEKEFPGDGGVFKLGGGIEYWQTRSMTIDFSLRYHGVFLHQKLAHDIEAGLALNFYTSP